MRRRSRSPRRGLILPRWLPLLPLALLLFLLLRSPPPKPPLPRRVAEAALSLVGKVGYFWGGKSLHLGPDPRWGMLRRVISSGSDTTGALLPFGLDCSGLVSWAHANAAGRAEAGRAVGEGVRAQYEGSQPIPWAEASPGDLAFFPDLSHVGIIVGRTEDGRLRVVHSSKTLGGVVLSDDAAVIGFTQIGRPRLYQKKTPWQKGR